MLTYNTDTNTGKTTINGKLASWALSLNVEMHPTGATGENAPSHEVLAYSPHGDLVPVGVTFTSKIRRGSKVGQDMLAVVIDEPALTGGKDKEIRFVAFPTDNPNEWDPRIDNSKPKDNTPAAPQAAPQYDQYGEEIPA